ncbi:MAG TPA: glycosyltransferase family 2 protein [Thermoplasmata archaeon]
MAVDKGDRALVLILNFNGFEDTCRCVESLRSDPDIPREDVVIVDNGSSDGSPERLKNAFPGLTVLETGANLGFAKGYNWAIKKLLDSHYGSILLLNNDTVVHRGALRALVETLQTDKTIGVVGPLILNMGTEIVQSAGIGIQWEKSKPVFLLNGEKAVDMPEEIRDVDFVSGSAMLVRTEALDKVGLFAEHFFMYAEEEDLCLRMRSAGYRVVCNTKARVEHKMEATVSKYPELRARYYPRNRFLVLKRHGTGGQFFRFTVWMIGFELPPLMFWDLVDGRLSVAYARVRGVIGGLLSSMSEKSLRSASR